MLVEKTRPMNTGTRSRKNLIRGSSTQVSVRELKARLLRYVARARAGEVIEVTSHGKAIAKLTGIASANAMGVARLVAIGAAQWHGGKPELGPGTRLAAGGRSLLDGVLESAVKADTMLPTLAM